MPVTSFTDEQSRALINLRQRYEVWITAERALAGLPYDLRRKTIAGRDYLYEIHDRGGNGKSLGPWDEEKARRFAAFRSEKSDQKQRRDGARGALAESARLYRALRLPMLSSDAGPILREADRRNMLGRQVMVVGTNAIAAYALEATGSLSGIPDETDDFDLAWSAEETSAGNRVWDLLKAVDSTFAINAERDFQARNAKAYEVELLVAPSRAATLSPTDRPRALLLPEQEWLLRGQAVDHVVGCRDGSPARIVAPDPRWFALHKLWMAEQPKRNPLKRPKDRKQGLALLDAIADAMPQYPLDDAFGDGLPADLQPIYAGWAEDRNPPDPPNW